MRNLNKPPRYNVASVQAQQTLGGDVMESAEDGQYVEWREYAWLLSEKQRLQAEVERLRFAEDLLKDENQHLREEEPLPDGWNSAVAKACDILAEKDKENARLKAEVEQRTAQAKRHKEVMLSDMQIIADNRLEIEMLKAEVERLTEAGDAMAELMFIDKDYIGSPKQEAVVEWCKATEGKQP